ncbi:MAG: substrate-binding domain-containing protein [Pseudomonadota bacterium]
MARSIGLALVFSGLAACGPSEDLSRFDGQVVPPPPPLGQSATLKIVGSSTVAPFSTTVAEQFGAATRFSTPIVETTGTGGGFKAFCQGVGAIQPSITNASRPIKPSETDLCARAGITDLIEVQIGFDGIVLANSRSAPDFNLTKAEIFKALADEVPDGETGWKANPHRMWSDISPDLPNKRIRVSGPPPTSGTRDAFVEIALEAGALEAYPARMGALKDADSAEFKRRAHKIRTDGAWIDSGENDTTIIQTLIKDDASLGVLGFSFLDQNADRVKAAKVGDVAATFENIASGDYGISRSLFFYVKAQNIPYSNGVAPFVMEFMQEDAWGPDGYLAEKGLIPMPEAQRRDVRQAVVAALGEGASMYGRGASE